MLVDPKATRVIKPEEQATKGKNNPYRGMEVPGSIRATFYAGHPTVLNGELATRAANPRSEPHSDRAWRW